MAKGKPVHSMVQSSHNSNSFVQNSMVDGAEIDYHSNKGSDDYDNEPQTQRDGFGSLPS